MVAQQPAIMQPVIMAPPVMFVYATPENPWAPLETCDHLLIEQQASLLEAVTQGAVEEANKYKIFVGTPQQGKSVNEFYPSFYAWEESECCSRCCLAPNHDLKVHFHAKDRQGNRSHPKLSTE